MIDALFNQPGYEAVKRMMDATVLRHEALASNISNMEVPGYKRVDLAPSFVQEMKRALQDGNSSKINTLQPSLAVDTTAVAANRDGNTVQMEKELLNMSQNTMAYSLETQLITRNMVKLRAAITGRYA